MTALKTLSILFFASLIIGCKSIQKTTTIQENSVEALVRASPIFGQAFTGFVLYDPSSKTTLATQYADKYFTPASNTKIFTLYTALQILGDSIPALHYQIKGDSLIFWGTGDPSFMNANLKNTAAKNFLSKWKGSLYYIPQKIERFGQGWAWDDYTGAYSTEKSAFPAYGNLITVVKKSNTETPSTYPKFFEGYLEKVSNSDNFVQRNETNNTLYYGSVGKTTSYSREVPYKVSDEIIVKLIEEAVGKKVTLLSTRTSKKRKTLYSLPTFQVLQAMMHPSDNFIAEQLLLLCAAEKKYPLTTEKVIKFATDSLLNFLPDPPIWKDGSGLSRYNLFTPRSMVGLLDKIYQDTDTATLFRLFPAGGQSGTIKNWYGGHPPYVFAKTGTLSNKHCLSGYIRTNSGSILIFSFMHNNYTGSSTPYKQEMQRVLELIRDQY